MSPQAYCQQKAAASGSSFYYSFLFLPKTKREAITALYAFCREVDDVVDDAVDHGGGHDVVAGLRHGRRHRGARERGRTGHRGHRGGADERGDLEVGDAGGEQRIDEVDALFDREPGASIVAALRDARVPQG